MDNRDYYLTQHELDLLITTAAAAGAKKALSEIGLTDDQAIHDVHELRTLLSSWRDAKRTATRSIVDWTTRGILLLLVVGAVYKHQSA